jgi:hypothetical protein
LSGQVGRAEGEIKTGGTERQNDRGYSSTNVAGTAPIFCGHRGIRSRIANSGTFCLICREQPTRYLDPSCLGFIRAKAACGEVALDLMELVAIYCGVVARRRSSRYRPAAKRPQHREKCCAGH